MNSLQRIAIIVSYEWKRALARKMLIILLVIAIAFEAFPFILFSRGGFFLPGGIQETMWVTGILSGQSLFVQLIAMQVAGSSMSDEYEQGTADILLSKPIKRVEYLAGKFLGGILVLSFVEVVTAVTGIVLSYGLFGVQQNIQFVPLMYAAVMYSILVFYSLTFMFSEFLRRSNLAMFAGFGVFLVSQIAGTALLFTSGQAFKDLSQLLPTWSATAFPASLAVSLNLQPSWWIISGLTFAIVGDAALAATIIAIYAVIFVLLAYVRFARSDVTKKTA